MTIIESKWFCFMASDRFCSGDGTAFRFVAVFFVLLVQIVGRLAETNPINYLADSRMVGDETDSSTTADKIKMESFHRQDKFLRDSSEKSGTSAESNGHNINLPYQNYRDSNDRFSASNVKMDGFLGKFQSMPLTTRVVRTKYGDLSGVVVSLDWKHLEPVDVFRGVPYAMPPTGNLRFMPPVSGALWSGVKNADKFGPVCPQRLPDISNETLALKRMPKGRLDYLKRLLPYLQNQSEDCLYLNIYAPAQEKGKNGGE